MLSAFSAGTTEITVGAVMSGAAAVVNDQVLLTAMALPARSLTPLVIVALIRLAYGSGRSGVKVAVLPSLLMVTLPAMMFEPLARVNVPV